VQQSVTILENMHLHRRVNIEKAFDVGLMYVEYVLSLPIQLKTSSQVEAKFAQLICEKIAVNRLSIIVNRHTRFIPTRYG